jgi:hypothetical protein
MYSVHEWYNSDRTERVRRLLRYSVRQGGFLGKVTEVVIDKMNTLIMFLTLLII